MPSETSPSLSAGASAWLPRLFAALRSFIRTARMTRRERTLRVCEMLALGDKRFLAVIECETCRLLIGGTQHSISLLDRLDSRSKPQPGGVSLEEPLSNGAH
jgi:flagellar biogenesis protein FliO